MNFENFAMLLDEFKELMIKNWTYDPWIKQETLESAIKNLEEEIEEFKADLKNTDAAAIELGDVLWDVFNLMFVFSKENNLPLEKALSEIINKMGKRKPYILEERFVTLDEAMKIWKEVKSKENLK
ncbi:MAG: hypothetical protein PWP03_107 [Candidatus Woesearchaeota archaeon]|nr:hypothetical protein [Candidatus Woesearchaeota archaeon]